MLFDLIINNLSKIVSSLEVAKPPEELDTAYDIKIVPLGQLRLKIVEFIYILVKLGRKEINQLLAESNIFAKISLLIE
jgi:hypothetical protein